MLRSMTDGWTDIAYYYIDACRLAVRPDSSWCCIPFNIGSEVMIKQSDTEGAHSCLSEECDMFCSKASSILTGLISKIFSGSILFQDMENTYQKKSQVMKLCAAAEDHVLDDIVKILDCRFNECTSFKEYKHILGSFCRKMDAANVQIEG